jgi:hypothetical protein
MHLNERAADAHPVNTSMPQNPLALHHRSNSQRATSRRGILSADPLLQHPTPSSDEEPTTARV